MNYGPELSQALVEELLDVIYKYEETLLVTTVIGCLEVVKFQLMEDAYIEVEDDDEDD